jgi:uncharacterized membrane protein
MEIFLLNLKWMIFNVLLAIIPVAFGWIMYRKRSLFIRIPAFLVWFFFLPNTMYLLTDIINVFDDIKHVTWEFIIADIILFVSLMPIGVLTYVAAVYPFEKMVQKNKAIDKKSALIILSFFVGFGLVLGRVLRLNSWEVLTETGNVIELSLEVFRSPQLIFLVLGFSLLTYLVYIFFKKDVIEFLRLDK